MPRSFDDDQFFISVAPMGQIIYCYILYWIVELDFASQLHAASKGSKLIQVQDTIGNSHDWPANEVISPKSNYLSQLQPGVWTLPPVFNHGGWDVVTLVKYPSDEQGKNKWARKLLHMT